ncbi:MAG: late competence development ComFB family protein [Nitrospirae bacterium]|nr:late competence development ComFB family protein [Nitrospirota bacterium]
MSAQSAMKLENANYERVILAIERLIAANKKYCQCMRCRLDVTAIALNGLPPKYFISPSSMEIEELASPILMVEASVLYALERVSGLPHHERPEPKKASDNIKKISGKIAEKDIE